jgi:hypothetical protein
LPPVHLTRNPPHPSVAKFCSMRHPIGNNALFAVRDY